jgi:hypothetical protein
MNRHRLALGLLLFLLAVPAVPVGAVPAGGPLTDTELLDTIQHAAFQFFLSESDTSNGLLRDRSQPGAPASIASNGFGFSALCIGVERGWITREDARYRVKKALNTYLNGPQGFQTSGYMGYRGLFYHFLDMNTGLRTWTSELSTIDTALLMAGVLDAMEFFDGTHPDEVAIRTTADSLYRRVDWEFMRNFGAGIRLGWKPETGFSGFGNWIGYNEAMILYILAIGSPTHPVPTFTWNTWTSGYSWQTLYGQTYVVFPPLFGHQYSHCWVDFRLTNDAYMNNKGITYFENSRRATLAQQAYAVANPGGWTGYGANLWGLTASDYPGGYVARGAPPAQNDEGTVTPTDPGGSVPFAPEATIPVLRNLYENYPALWGPYGFKDAFNPTQSWYGTDYIGIDQGPIVIMIENYRTGSTWKRMMSNPYVLAGLTGAGFVTNVSVEPPRSGPRIEMAPAQPNPFAGRTSLRFVLPSQTYVRLNVHDISGRRVAQLVDGVLPAGAHSATFDAANLPSGVYICKLEADGAATVRPVVHLK